MDASHASDGRPSDLSHSQQDTSTQSEDADESSPKRKKLRTDSPNGSENLPDTSSSTEKLEVLNGSHSKEQDIFKNFKVVKLLKADASRKVIFVHGTFEDDKHAVAILEKDAFGLDNLDEIFASSPQGILDFQNDIYHNYRTFFSREFNSVKTTLIYPATEEHLEKYSRHDMHIIEETAEDYRNITLPLLVQEKRFSLKWVDNILDHKKESERIVFEDPDKENGFILLPDLKWDAQNVETLYLIALPHKRDLHSIRELTGEHLPMLRNINAGATKAIGEKYGLPASRIRAFFHYQPTFYHLHVHFTNIQYDAPGKNAEKAHMLTTVISNLEICSEYYKRATIPFLVGGNDMLFKIYADKNASEKKEEKEE
ncbi:m7GpppX diphosphatase-like [Paramacrobiotus metropolitanus]|uniref:m7GpppX diphosphatase-like n=1 Tax=Paramacrobiotus metropolitanus TaxID=2943436 RepID=UPI0024458FD5|nr:m7GpppX diphosphatase-like [Paramacrobiotus metropolitanus]